MASYASSFTSSLYSVCFLVSFDTIFPVKLVITAITGIITRSRSAVTRSTFISVIKIVTLVIIVFTISGRSSELYSEILATSSIKLLSTLADKCESKYLNWSSGSFFPASLLKSVCIFTANTFVAYVWIYVKINPAATRTATYIQNCLLIYSEIVLLNNASIACDIFVFPKTNTFVAIYALNISIKNSGIFFIKIFVKIFLFFILCYSPCIVL